VSGKCELPAVISSALRVKVCWPRTEDDCLERSVSKPAIDRLRPVPQIEKIRRRIALVVLPLALRKRLSRTQIFSRSTLRARVISNAGASPTFSPVKGEGRLISLGREVFASSGKPPTIGGDGRITFAVERRTTARSANELVLVIRLDFESGASAFTLTLG
jgi:hypothetical protein